MGSFDARSRKFTASRENASTAEGDADWRPQLKSLELIEQVKAIIADYDDYLPLTVRQIFYLLVGNYGYEKTENAYERLTEKIGRARRARMIPFDVIRDDGVVTYSARWFDGPDALADDAAAFVRADRVILTQRIEAERIALTRTQVEEFDLETAPTKPGDTRAKNWQGETCQLEALPPEVLAGLVEDAIAAHFDAGKLGAEIDQEQDDRSELLLALPAGPEYDEEEV